MAAATLMTLAAALLRLETSSTSERRFLASGINGNPPARSQESPA